MSTPIEEIEAAYDRLRPSGAHKSPEP
jgi:hypothetical protein